MADFVSSVPGGDNQAVPQPYRRPKRRKRLNDAPIIDKSRMQPFESSGCFSKTKLEDEDERWKTVLIKASTFLELVPLSRNYVAGKYEEISKNPTNLDVPFLSLEVYDETKDPDTGMFLSGKLAVENHEGRHRALYIKKTYGDDAMMPLRLVFKNNSSLPEVSAGSGNLLFKDGRIILRGPKFIGMRPTDGEYFTTEFAETIRQQYSDVEGGEPAQIKVFAGPIDEGSDIAPLWLPSEYLLSAGYSQHLG